MDSRLILRIFWVMDVPVSRWIDVLGNHFKGPIIPYGSLVECYPTSAKHQSRIHQFGKKVLFGLFLGYALYGGGLWKGDILVADIEELETMDAPEIYSKRLNANKVIFPRENGKYFPVADGRIKPLGRDRNWEHPVGSSHQIIDLWSFADRYSIPLNLPTNFHPDLIATIRQKCLLLFCALLSQQSHLFLICAV